MNGGHVALSVSLFIDDFRQVLGVSGRRRVQTSCALLAGAELRYRANWRDDRRLAGLFGTAAN